MSLIAALALSALGLSVRAVLEYNDPSGDQASDIVGVASAQVGYSEGGDGYTKYGDWYGLPYSDWCAMFVSWCANQAGVSTDVFPRFALCAAGADWFISHGQFHYAGSYAPQAGDLIFYSSYGDIYHVGLVTGSDGYNVYSVEGNYNEAVCNVSYPLSYGDILGYATPAYSAQSVQPEATADESNDDEIVEEVVNEDNSSNDNSNEDKIIEDDSDEDEAELTSSAPERKRDRAKDMERDSETEIESDNDTANNDVVSETEEVKEETSDDTDLVAEDELIAEDSDEDSAAEAADSDTDSEITSTETDADSELDSSDTDSSEDKDFGVNITGDVNGDGVVDSADALLIQRYLAGSIDESEVFSYINADADASGEITITDALIVLEMSVHTA